MTRYYEGAEDGRLRAAAAKEEDANKEICSQRHSLYTPIHTKSARKGSISKSDDKGKRERETTASRASADPSTGRRRATMRSKEHDDEEEQLQRALEESKREVESTGNGRRVGKRGRENGDE